MMMGAIHSEGEKDRTMIFGISKLLEGTDWIRFSVLFSFLFFSLLNSFWNTVITKHTIKVLKAS